MRKTGGGPLASYSKNHLNLLVLGEKMGSECGGTTQRFGNKPYRAAVLTFFHLITHRNASLKFCITKICYFLPIWQNIGIIFTHSLQAASVVLAVVIVLFDNPREKRSAPWLSSQVLHAWNALAAHQLKSLCSRVVTSPLAQRHYSFSVSLSISQHWLAGQEFRNWVLNQNLL